MCYEPVQHEECVTRQPKLCLALAVSILPGRDNNTLGHSEEVARLLHFNPLGCPRTPGQPLLPAFQCETCSLPPCQWNQLELGF